MNKLFSHAGVRKEQLPRYNFVALLALTSFIFLLILSPISSAIPSSSNSSSQGGIPITRAIYPQIAVTYLNITVNNSDFLNGFNYLTLPLSTASTNAFNNVYSNATSTFVPYVGANKNVDLNDFNLTLGSLAVNYSISGIGSNFNPSKLGGVTFGFINSSLSNSTGNINNSANGLGEFAFGGINLRSTNSSAFIRTAASGSHVTGIITVTGGNNNIVTIDGQGVGSFVNIASTFNTATNVTSINGVTSSTGIGAFAVGRVTGSFTPTNQNPSITANNAGSFAQGNAAIGQIISSGTGSFAQGSISSGGLIQAIGAGSFAQGGMSVNGTIISSGTGSFAHGSPSASGEYIVASNNGAVALGYRNLSSSGVGSIALGQNVNVTGSNTLAFGVGSAFNLVNGNNQFWTNAYLNVTQNASVEQLFRVGLSVALPACNSASNLSVGRNLTGLYDCPNGNGTWVKLG